MDLFDFVLEVLVMIPWPVWVGTLLGMLFAIGFWHFFPENADRLSVAGYCIAVGFLGGWLYSLIARQSKS